MPGFDRAGPTGQGPTGRGRGRCGSETRTPAAYPVIGMGRAGVPRGEGRGRCFGGGQGGRHRRGPQPWTGAPGPGRAQLDVLRSQAARLEEQLQAIKERLSLVQGEAAAEE